MPPARVSRNAGSGRFWGLDLRHTSLLKLVGVTALAALCGPAPALAESMSSALARAYDNNPDINQQRAAVRA